MISADQSNIDSQRGQDPVRDEHAHQMTTAQRYQEFFTRKKNSWDAPRQYDLDVIVPKNLQNNIHFWYLVYLSSELIHHRIGAFYQKHESAVEPEDAKNVGQLILEMAVHAYEEEQKRGIDFLTQLNNRELFKRQLNLLEQEASRPNDLAVVMIDLDDFKKANEVYGHPKGDILLRKIAERMKEKVNEFFSFSTALFRYGGEEFVAIVPLKTEENRNEFVKHLHDFCEALTSEQYDLDGVSYDVHLSVGVCIVPKNTHIKNYDDVVKQADSRLYSAKNTKLGCPDEALRGKKHYMAIVDNFFKDK